MQQGKFLTQMAYAIIMFLPVSANAQVGGGSLATTSPSSTNVPPSKVLYISPVQIYSSATLSDGDQVQFVVTQDAKSQEGKYIQKSTPIVGTVTHAKKAGFPFRNGELNIAFSNILASDGTPLTIKNIDQSQLNKLKEAKYRSAKQNFLEKLDDSASNTVKGHYQSPNYLTILVPAGLTAYAGTTKQNTSKNIAYSAAAVSLFGNDSVVSSLDGSDATVSPAAVFVVHVYDVSPAPSTPTSPKTQ